MSRSAATMLLNYILREQVTSAARGAFRLSDLQIPAQQLCDLRCFGALGNIRLHTTVHHTESWDIRSPRTQQVRPSPAKNQSKSTGQGPALTAFYCWFLQASSRCDPSPYRAQRVTFHVAVPQLQVGHASITTTRHFC